MNFLKNLFNKKNIKVFEHFYSQNSITQIIALDLRNLNAPKHFILNDPVALSKTMQKKWASLPSEGLCRGGYDYSITFFENEKKLDYSLICFECNSLTFQSKIYGIKKSNILSTLNSNFIPLYEHSKIFKDKETGRKFWSTVKSNPELIVLENQIPQWLNYDGEFSVYFPVEISLAYQPEKTKDILKAKMKKFNPTENFSLSYIAMSGNKEEAGHLYKVFGSKNLFENTKDLSKMNWKEFTEFKLPLFSKDSEMRN